MPCVSPTMRFSASWIRLLLYACAVLVLAWACIDPRFRNGEGSITSAFCLPAAGSMALMVLAVGVRTRCRTFALWLAVATFGQAVTLQMIEAGPSLRYQHYMTLDGLRSGSHRLFLVWLAFQLCLVAVGFGRVAPAVRTWLHQTFTRWQLVGAVIVVTVSSAVVSRDVARSAVEVLVATFVQAIHLGTIVLAVTSLPLNTLQVWTARLDALLTGATGDPREPHLDRFAMAAAAWVLIVTALLATFSYQRHPHIPDEVTYVYHARYFAAGFLTMPAPPVPEAFDLDLMSYEADRWYSPMPPGWPAALAIGIWLGAAWLVNPLLAALNILLAYVLLQDLYDLRRARVATLLLCLSPWYLFMAMNFMNHTFATTAALCAAVAVVRARRTGRARWGWAAGMAIGVTSLIRPLDGLIVAGLLGAWSVGLGGTRLRLAAVVGLVAGSIAAGSLVLPYNRVLSGDPMTNPLNAYFDKYYRPNVNALGFGADRGLNWPIDPFPGHSPLDAVVNAGLNISSLNTELFGWSSGSVVFIAPLLVAGAWGRSDRLMLGVIAAVMAVYALYWFGGGPDFGARYWYLVMVPCAALTASGVQFVKNSLPARWSFAGTRVLVAMLILCVLSVVNFLPWRAIDKYFHFRSMRPDIRALSAEHAFGKSVVLIRGERHPDYASAAVYNPIDLRADATIYAWDRSPAVRTEVIKAYADRPIWLVDGPSLAGGRFRVVSGPLLSLNAEEIRRAVNQQ